MSVRGADILTPRALKSARPTLVVASVAINVLSVALPLYTLQVYDRAIPNQSTETLIILTIGVAVAIMVETALRLVRAAMIARIGADFERDASHTVLSRLLFSNNLDRINPARSDYLDRMRAVRALRDFHSGHALTVAVDAAFMFAFLALIAYIGGAIVVAPIIVAAIVVVSASLGSLQLRASLEERRTADQRRYDFLISTLNGVAGVKCFSLSGLVARRFEPLEYRASLATYAVLTNSASILNAGLVLSGVTTASAVTIGALAAYDGALSIGALIACVLLCGRLTPTIQRATLLWMKRQDYDVARDRFVRLFDRHQPLIVDRAAPPETTPYALQIRRLTFQRRRDDAPFLKNANLRARIGEALIVQAGDLRRGSLFLRIVAGREDGHDGDVLWSGALSRGTPFERRAERVGYLSSDAELFSGSILDNVSCFGLRSHQASIDAARIFGVDKDVAQLPNGWRTRITGRANDEVSLGLARRIVMARMIAARPGIIALDRADRFLDTESYDALVSAVVKMKRFALVLLNTNDQNLARLSDGAVDIDETGALGLRRAPRSYPAIALEPA
ncbi:MAG: ABC transporter transmembrane domain-containing protein [Parvularculaceae bacterium]